MRISDSFPFHYSFLLIFVATTDRCKNLHYCHPCLNVGKYAMVFANPLLASKPINDVSLEILQ